MLPWSVPAQAFRFKEAQAIVVITDGKTEATGRFGAFQVSIKGDSSESGQDVPRNKVKRGGKPNTFFPIG